MAKPIMMPDLAATADTITLIEWKVKPGDTVKRGQPLAAIETDKAVTELESVAEGTVLKLLAEDGDVIEVGEVIAYVGTPGESLPDTVTPTDTTAEQPEPDKEKPMAARRPAKDAPRVSPLIRNLAKKMSVDLAQLKGTGNHGMITRQDVLDAANSEP
jgi:pyruvate/2-oxoglutarate dehydrogenase complex dihydrolipoamide acyltransferase (E2) component